MQAIISYFTANHYAELIGTIGNIILIAACLMHGERKIRTMLIKIFLVAKINGQKHKKYLCRLNNCFTIGRTVKISGGDIDARRNLLSFD